MACPASAFRMSSHRCYDTAYPGEAMSYSSTGANHLYREVGEDLHWRVLEILLPQIVVSWKWPGG
jgi:hypothetical protein